MIRVTAILVTYNRLNLLKEALNAIKQQSYCPTQIVVVDNGSTDGTGAWLDEQTGIEVIHQVNQGGSGGFFSGMQYAAKCEPDWLWLMDDDTICQPDSLAVMLNKLSLVEGKIGFISSKAVWTDGKPHLMNLPAIAPSFNDRIPFNIYDSSGLLLTETSSFVSLLVSMAAIKEVGLPYKEFFIWGDDQEYTKRITNAGYWGFYCIDSVVHHKTPVNYFPDFYRDNVSNLWKHSYGFRNEFFMVKKNKGFAYFICWLVMKFFYTSYRLIVIRKHDRLKFISTLAGSAWRSIFFDPKIEHI